MKSWEARKNSAPEVKTIPDNLVINNPVEDLNETVDVISNGQVKVAQTPSKKTMTTIQPTIKNDLHAGMVQEEEKMEVGGNDLDEI